MQAGSKSTMTREQWIHQVRDLVVARVEAEDARLRLLAAKLVYGAGQRGIRGICYYAARQNGQPRPVE